MVRGKSAQEGEQRDRQLDLYLYVVEFAVKALAHGGEVGNGPAEN